MVPQGDKSKCSQVVRARNVLVFVLGGDAALEHLSNGGSLARTRS